MSTPDSTSRRHFIASVAGIAGAAAAASVVPWERAAAEGQAPAKATAWDDSWTQRLGTHRVVFEQSALDQDPGPAWLVPSVMDGYHEALGTTDKDLGIVLVLRHRAVPYFFSDALWLKYDIAKGLKAPEDKAEKPVRTNPMREHVLELQKRGVTVLGCHRAVQGFISRMADERKVKREEVEAEVTANLFPGVILQPNGLYAVARAQDAGCGIMR